MTSMPATEQQKSVFNPRLIVILLVVLLPAGWFVWTFARLTLSGGIEQAGQYKWVNLKEMGNFPFNEVTGSEQDVPARFRQLDGQKVLFDGQMYVERETGDRVREFQLVYSIQNCCFNGPPKVQERVFAHSASPVPYFYQELAKVYGTLHIRVRRENGKVISLFDMDVEKVER